ncbi:MAG TPA: arginase family protein [Flavobacteriaceae bacterium]|nr:arginase family protein [Flavobacteriaceae bacterium]
MKISSLTEWTDWIKIYNKESVAKFINPRAGESKLGEHVCFISHPEELKNHPAKYVLLGIPEDIGVRANYGKPGTSEAWEATLGAFLNIQDNHFTNANNLILLGEIDCDKQMVQAHELSQNIDHNVEELGELVIQIDHKVERIVETIVAAGKIAIIIGGGHNNSYGNLSGTSAALGKKINCINMDAHTDFRSLEHRHSGNGFTYAFARGYLSKYFIFGLHQNYTSENVLCAIRDTQGRVQFSLFEDIELEKTKTFTEALQEAEDFCCNDDFGIELDLDSIEGMGSSAMTSSGFSMTKARRFLRHFSKLPNLRYVHLCEGAPKAGLFPNAVAKGISYLISDVINEKK